LAKQEAIENPYIVIAINTYEDDLHKLRRQRARGEEEVKWQYENDLREAQSSHRLGEKRARDTRNDREEQVQQEFENAKSRIDTILTRKIAHARQTKQHPFQPPQHEAFSMPSPATNPAAMSTASSPYLPIPPPTPRPGLGGSRALSDAPMEEGHSTPRSSTNTRLSSSRDGPLSPRTPGINIAINPQVIDASATGTSVGGSGSGRLDFEPGAGACLPSPRALDTEVCMSAACRGKPLKDRSHCAEHDCCVGEFPSPSP
jgi:hypothetical protein